MTYSAAIKGHPCRGETLEVLVDLYAKFRKAHYADGNRRDFKAPAEPVYLTGTSEPVAFITPTTAYPTFTAPELRLIRSLCEMCAEVRDPEDPFVAVATSVADRIKEVAARDLPDSFANAPLLVKGQT